MHKEKWDPLSFDFQKRPTCLWHCLGFMLVRQPITDDQVIAWRLFRKEPYAFLDGITAQYLEDPYCPPTEWAEKEILNAERKNKGVA